MREDEAQLASLSLVDLLDCWARSEKHLGDEATHVLVREMLRQGLSTSVCRPDPDGHGPAWLAQEAGPRAEPAGDR